MKGTTLIPFFVADRPASLRILRKIDLSSYDGPLGIMAHANTSKNFKNFLRVFPCNPESCDRHCDEYCSRLAGRVVKMCDSGAFSKRGCRYSYSDLFAAYEEMGVDYGIMADHLRDMEKTLESARLGIKEYRKKDWHFKLIGVAQGRSPTEYLKCYRALKRLGYECVAVGGLLKKRSNTSRYTYVQGNGVLYKVLERIRKEYPEDWLFALGCYHPRRHLRFQRLNLYGSDYKGWIFNYVPRKDLSTTQARASRYRQVRSFISREILGSPFYPGNCQHGGKRKQGTLVVISCGAKKIWREFPEAGPTRARDAYTGQFFRKNRKYAETFGDRWAILSAKYGLVDPDFPIPGDYDVKFNHRNATITTKDIREQIIKQRLNCVSQVVVLGGHEYGEAISEALSGLGVSVLRPLEKYRSIGRMTAAVTEAIKNHRQLE